MALLWAESFEQYGDDETQMSDGVYTQLAQSMTLNTTGTPRTGTTYLRIRDSDGGFGSSLRRVFGPISSGGIAMGVRMFTLPSGSEHAGFNIRTGTGETIFGIEINSSGSIEIRNGNITSGGTTTLATSGPRILAGTWHHIEVKFTVSSTVGQVEVRVDGIDAVAVSNVNLGTADAADIQWIAEISLKDLDIDDVIAWDQSGSVSNDWFGPQRVFTGYLDTDSTIITFDWSVTGASSGAEALDEVPADDDTSYIGAATAGDRAAFTMPTLPANISGIGGVYIQAKSRQEDAGVSSIRLKAQSGASETVGQTEQLTPTYSYNGWSFTVDPQGSGEWTKARFEGATLEIERVT